MNFMYVVLSYRELCEKRVEDNHGQERKHLDRDSEGHQESVGCSAFLAKQRIWYPKFHFSIWDRLSVYKPLSKADVSE